MRGDSFLRLPSCTLLFSISSKFISLSSKLSSAGLVSFGRGLWTASKLYVQKTSGKVSVVPPLYKLCASTGACCSLFRVASPGTPYRFQRSLVSYFCTCLLVVSAAPEKCRRRGSGLRRRLQNSRSDFRKRIFLVQFRNFGRHAKMW